MTSARLKHATLGAPTYGLNVPASDYLDEGVRMLRTTDITDDGRLTEHVEPVYVGSERAIDAQLRAGDLLISRSGTVGRSYLHDGARPATFAGYLVRFRPKRGVDPRYLYYWTKSKGFDDQVEVAGTQSTIVNVNAQKYANMRLTLPEAAVQHAIVDFLDRETVRIDQLLEKKQRLIGLLEEKRTALISHAVTKGLDPTAPMKDSGVPWLGNIPVHWQAAPVYSRYKVFLGKMLSEVASTGPEPRPYLRNLNVQWDRIDLTDLAEMSFDAHERVKYRLKRQDLLVCEGGEVGRAAMWQDELDECYFQKALLLVRPWSNRELPRFLMYVLHSAAHMAVFRVEGNRATFVHLTGEKLRAHRFGFPSRVEQEAIVNHIDDLTSDLGRVLLKVRGQLDLLAEYRQALITAAVTGHLDAATRQKNPEEVIA